jgi:hypothetical protein
MAEVMPCAVRTYYLVCLTSLVLIFLALVHQGVGPWALFPVVVGGVALGVRWPVGPVIVLLSLALLLMAHQQGVDPYRMTSRFLAVGIAWLSGVDLRITLLRRSALARGSILLADLGLATGFLVYCAGFYRLLGLVESLFPADRPVRRRSAASRKALGQRTPQAPSPLSSAGDNRRSQQSVTTRESLLLLPVLLAYAGGALGLWFWVRMQPPLLDLSSAVSQGLLLLWIVGGGMALAAGLLRSLAWRQLKPQEALLYLQDIAWRETRGDQRRLNRWLAWAWLRRRRRRGGTS